jgi:hypothetical protein
MYAVELFTHESQNESESERDPSEAFRDVTVDPIWPPQQSAKAKKKKLHCNFPCIQKFLAHKLIGRVIIYHLICGLYVVYDEYKDRVGSKSRCV